MNAPLSSANVALAETLATQLQALLESEFESLRAGTLDGLEDLQSRKLVLLEQMAQVAPGQLVKEEDLPAEWMGFAELARDCRRLHQRNEMLVTRKLDAVRGALTALQVSSEGLIDETYDRKGRLSWGGAPRRRTANNAYQDV
jgi:flagellar biosynthesis/type III secretory pathway chaperone